MHSIYTHIFTCNSQYSLFFLTHARHNFFNLLRIPAVRRRRKVLVRIRNYVCSPTPWLCTNTRNKMPHNRYNGQRASVDEFVLALSERHACWQSQPKNSVARFSSPPAIGASSSRNDEGSGSRQCAKSRKLTKTMSVVGCKVLEQTKTIHRHELLEQSWRRRRCAAHWRHRRAHDYSRRFHWLSRRQRHLPNAVHSSLCILLLQRMLAMRWWRWRLEVVALTIATARLPASLVSCLICNEKRKRESAWEQVRDWKSTCVW